MAEFLAALRGGQLLSSQTPPIRVDGLLVYFKGYIASADDGLPHILGDMASVGLYAACIARAYRKWGPALSQHIHGEFSVAIYDTTAGSVLLAQDCLGLVSLYYRCEKQSILFGSDLADLASGLGPEDVDEEYIADYLCFGDHEGDR